MVTTSIKEDVRARREAVRLLGAMGMKETAKDEFAKGLDSADAAERLTAVEAMVKMGLRTKSAGSALCKALTDESDGVRRAAAQHFRYIAAPSMPFAVEPLRKALSDKDAEIRSFAVIALGKIGPKATAAVPDLLRLLNDPATTDRRNLVEAVIKTGVGLPEVLEVVLAARRDPGTAQVVADALRNWPTFPPSAAPALLELVRDVGMRHYHEVQCVHAGLRALARIVPRPPEVLEELRAQLAADNAHIAAGLLGEIGSEAAHLLPDLLAALHRRGPDWSLSEIATAIVKLGREGITALVQLLDGEPTEDTTIPAFAAMALNTGGPAARSAARSALPALLALLARFRRSNVTRGRECVMYALAAIGPDAAAAVPDIVAILLKATEPHEVRSLLGALQAFGPVVLPSVPQLAETLRQPIQERVHESIVRFITTLIPHGLDVLPILRDVLRRATTSYENADYSSSHFPRLQVAREAISGLAKLGPAAQAAVPDLVLWDQTVNARYDRELVVTAFGKIGGAALPHIRAALSDPDDGIRSAAVGALGETGDKSAETRNALRALETDSNEHTRALAASLLQKM
jgi:HEAT repeat protein